MEKYHVRLSISPYHARLSILALELRRSTVPFLCQSVHLGCARIGRQLHPLKAKITIGTVSIELYIQKIVSSYCYTWACPRTSPFTLSARPSVCLYVHWFVRPSWQLRGLISRLMVGNRNNKRNNNNNNTSTQTSISNVRAILQQQHNPPTVKRSWYFE